MTGEDLGGTSSRGLWYIEGAQPGDVLEVKILSVDFAIDYGYNGCNGFIPANCDRAVPLKILTIDRQAMTSEFKPGIVVPLRPFFGSMGVAPSTELGRVSSNPAGRQPAIWTIENSWRVARYTFRFLCLVRCFRSATVTVRRVTERSTKPASRHLFVAVSS